MQGFQLTFFTQQDRRIHGLAIADWLVKLAKEMDLRGATQVAAGEGIGRDRRIHSARFFELADQPVEVIIVVTPEDADRLFDRLTKENVRIFYVKTPAEFGILGEEGK